MNTNKHLFALATVYANAAVRTDRARRALQDATAAERSAASSAVHTAEEALLQARDTLKANLRIALDRPVHAVPDKELPVATWHHGHVDIRAVTGSGDNARTVRVRYSAEQALAAGTALIACAAITDQRLGGTLSSILGPFPPARPTTTAPGASGKPTDETPGNWS